MKRVSIHRAREVFKIKNQIFKILPYAKDVDVKIERMDEDLFQTAIKVEIPHHPPLFAAKSAESLKVCLEKNRQAILKQIDKVKNRRFTKIPVRLTA